MPDIPILGPPPKESPFTPLGKMFFKENIFEAFGTTMEETLEKFSKSIGEIVSEEMSEAVKKIVEELKKGLGDISDLTTSIAGKIGEKSREVTKESMKDFDRYTDEALQRAKERYNELEKSARLAKEQLERILPKLEKDEGLKKAFAMLNLRPSYDLSSGQVMFDVGGKKLPIEQISTEQLMNLAYTGQLTATPDYAQKIQSIQSGIQAIGGIVTSVTPAISQGISTIAPDPMERISIARNIGSGVGNALTAAGGVAMMIPGGQAVGAALAAIGVVTNLVTGIFSSISESIERRNIEVAQRGAKFEWGGVSGTEGEKMYREMANLFYPLIKKEQMEEMLTSFAQIGIAMENIRGLALESARAFSSLGLSQQEAKSLASVYYENIGIPPEVGLAGMRATTAMIPALSATTSPTEAASLFTYFAGQGAQMGLLSFGEGTASKDIGFLVSLLCQATGASEEEIKKVGDAFLRARLTWLPNTGKRNLESLTRDDILAGFIYWIRKYIPPQAAQMKLDQGFVDSMCEAIGGINHTTYYKLASWLYGGGVERTAALSRDYARLTAVSSFFQGLDYKSDQFMRQIASEPTRTQFFLQPGKFYEEMGLTQEETNTIYKYARIPTARLLLNLSEEERKRIFEEAGYDYRSYEHVYKDYLEYIASGKTDYKYSTSFDQDKFMRDIRTVIENDPRYVKPLPSPADYGVGMDFFRATVSDGKSATVQTANVTLEIKFADDFTEKLLEMIIDEQNRKNRSEGATKAGE